MSAIPEGVVGPGSDDGWLPPPTGPSPEAGSEEQPVKVSPAEVSMLVDKIVEGIRAIENGIASALKEDGLKATEGELWGYSILIGWAIKKYAMKADMVMLGTAALAIIAAWAVKVSIIAAKRKKQAPKTTQQQMEDFVNKQPPEQVAEFAKVQEGADGTAA